MPRPSYTFEFHRQHLDLITEGLCELQAKRVLHFISFLHQAVAQQDAEHDQALKAQQKAERKKPAPPPPDA